MSKFTPGRWSIAPPIFDGDAIFAPPQEKGRRNEVVAMGILNKADARLIVAAPEMYGMLYEVMQELKGYETKVSYKKTYYELIQELLDCIDGKEENHE